jgi:hypothetical protein
MDTIENKKPGRMAKEWIIFRSVELLIETEYDPSHLTSNLISNLQVPFHDHRVLQAATYNMPINLR